MIVTDVAVWYNRIAETLEDVETTFRKERTPPYRREGTQALMRMLVSVGSKVVLMTNCIALMRRSLDRKPLAIAGPKQ